MTSIEARQKIDACENQIVSAYSGLRDNAKSVGSRAFSAASQKTLLSLLLPLIICIIGVLFIKSAWFLGCLLILAGIICAGGLYSSAKDVQNVVENEQKKLNSAIDSNPQH